MVATPTLSLPRDVYTPSTSLALLTLSHAIFLSILGCYAVSVSPWYLWWAGALVSGCAMSWLYIVGWDCSQRSFFRWRWANHLVGVLCTLLMLRPFSSLRLPYPEERTVAAARLKRVASCFSFRELKALYAEGDWRRNTMPLIDLSTVCVFAAVFFPLMLYYLGVGGLIKFWLIPFVDMHIRIGTFTNVLTRVPYLALFHPEISPMIPKGMQKLLGFPSYNIRKAHVHISKQMQPQVPVSEPASGISGVVRAVCAPINAIAFGRFSRDTPVIAYAIGVLIAASALYHRTFASVLLVPTMLYIARSLSNKSESSTASKAEVIPAPPADFATKPHWFNRIYLGIMHVLALYAFYHAYAHFNVNTMIFSFIMYHFAAFGITAGAHRFWAHRTYNAAPSLRILMMVMNLFSGQGSIYKWVRDHRLHHKHVDTDNDPHNSLRGFWWSHCGWLMYKKSKTVVEAGKNVFMDDIKADKYVMWQHRNYAWAMPLCSFALPTAVAYSWGDAVGGYFIAGVLRYLLTLHSTWFVNSIAHIWGSRPYIPNIRPAENLFVSLCADGEGWHNYHHAFPYDYSTNEHGVFQYNPTTAFVNICAYLGLVTDRRRAVIPDGKNVKRLEELPFMSLQDVETCAKQAACIVAIDDVVYDLTAFEDNHPAGPQILRDFYGKDASLAFHGELHKHTEVAINMMSTYRVARLAKK